MEYTLDPVSLFWNATWVVKIVMIILTLMSFATWAIVVLKIIEFYLAEKEDGEFLEGYREINELDLLYTMAKDARMSPKAGIFTSVYSELKKLIKSGAYEDENISRAILRAREEKRLRLQKFLVFLSTTASSAPFIGLFGTVWGIMHAFFKIGKMKSVGLHVVAPAIAEALIATAFGLLAAIPAAIAYNYFLSKMRKIFSSADLFSSELMNTLKRHFIMSEKRERD